MPDETDILHRIDEKHWSRLIEGARRELAARGIDAAIAYLAAEQYEMVARWELAAAGVGRGAIDLRRRVKRLHDIETGVYSPASRLRAGAGAFMAAVLTAGPDSLLGRRSAAAHWNMRPSATRRVEVIAPRTLPKRPRLTPIRGLVASDEWTIHDGIPITTVPRTILDLAAVLSRDQLEQAMERAEALRLTDALTITELLQRYPRRRGSVALRAILGAESIGHGVTREELEAAFNQFIHERGFPRPRINAPLAVGADSFTADFVWPAARLIVELDGYATHWTRRSFERDRRRDRRLLVVDWKTIRVTWRHLHEEREELAADMAAIFARRGRAAA